MAHFPKPFFKKSRGVWYVEINRKQINLGSDRDDAFQRYHRLMGSPREQPVASDSLAAIIDAFLEWVQRNRSPDTYEWYRYRLQRFIERYPDMRAGDLKPHHVETWVGTYEFSVTSRRNYLRSVKRCLKWAKKQGYIDSNPIADLEVPSGEAREVYLAQEEFDLALELIPDPSFRDLMQATYVCGCRPQESLIVTAVNVDRQNQRWIFERAKSKGKRIRRVVYLNQVALAITERAMSKYPEGPLFRNIQGKPWTTESANCACDRLRLRLGRALIPLVKAMLTDEKVETDRPMLKTLARRVAGEVTLADIAISDAELAAFVATLRSHKSVKGVQVAKTKSELRAEARRKLTNRIAKLLAPRYSLYALRHSWATNALQNGVDALTVAILMGHSDPSTLSKVYQHVALNPQHMLEQAKRAAG